MAATIPTPITYAEAQARLGAISRSSLQRLIRRRELEIVLVGRARRIDARSIERYLRRRGED